MLKHILILSASLLINILTAQNVSISNNGNAPDSSAMLDIQSTSKGLLIPRMTLAQRDQVTAPATGLMIYQTDNIPGLYAYDGAGWKIFTTSSNVWSTAGNAGMDPNTQFIGTTDLNSLRFRVNNKWAGELNPLYLNMSFGDSSGISVVNAFYNTSFGNKSLRLNEYGSENTAIGYESLSNNRESLNTALGYQALQDNTFGSANTAVGNKALEYNTTGSKNTAMGRWALNYNTTGTNNTGCGYATLSTSTTGSNNTAVGAESMYVNLSGTSNTAVGYAALRNNDAGFYNIAIGNEALRDNTIGSYNTAIGVDALLSNTNGTQNIAIGYASLYTNSAGYENFAAGYGAMFYNTVGTNNIAIGSQALYSNIAGSGNVAIGKQALNVSSNFVGNTAIGTEALQHCVAHHNTGVGYNVMKSNTNGNENTGLGSFALYTNTTGYSNVAVGYAALYSTFGYSNTAIGSLALTYSTSGIRNTAVGRSALYLNTTGQDNVAIGHTALSYNVTGQHNIAIGSYADVTESLYNTISIGNSGIPNADHSQAIIGNLSHEWIGGNVPWSTFSDARIKTDVREDVKGLDFITRLRPVTYHRDIDLQTQVMHNAPTEDFPHKYDIEQIKFSGFLAQEVEEAAHASGYEFSGITVPKNEHSVYTLSYETFVVPLVKAVQEQQAIIENQNQRINSLEERLAKIEHQMKQ